MSHIFISHFIITCVICGIGSFALLKLLVIVIKRKLISEKYVFVSLYLLYSFSYYDFLIMLMPNLESIFPGYHLEFDPLVQMIYFTICLTFAGTSISFTLYAMIRILTIAHGPVTAGKWLYVALNVLLLFLFISILQSSSLHDLEGYKTIISTDWMIGVIIFPISFVLAFLTVNLSFFPFLRNQGKILNINIKKDQIYGLLINLVIILYALGLGFRIFLGTNWDAIEIADVFFLSSTIIAVSLGIYSGFGESLLCLRNMESIYIVHQSGKLIYSRKFFPESLFDEEFFGAFLLIINEITKEIRTRGGTISQIVLEDNSEIIFWKGDFIEGILITKIYNPLFIKKLQELVCKIEQKIGSDLETWSGKRLELDQQIDGVIRDLF